MVKVGDFGLAVQLEHSCSNRVGFCGTSLYAGPEVYRNTVVLKSDVWSLGISIIEMAEGRHPFAGLTMENVVNRVLNGDPPSLSSSGWSSDLADFVRKCLVKDVSARSSVDALLKVSVSLRYEV